MMRLGPKPLPFQLGMASLASAGLAGGAQFDAATLQDFFAGIQKYQAHDFKRVALPLDKVWEAGQASLYCAPSVVQTFDIPIVLIPSMINKSDILDLMPDRSLLRWLSAHGFKTYLFDWGQSVEDEQQSSFDLALERRLMPAIHSIGGPVITLGYCMGGLFSAAMAALDPGKLCANVMLATPWNFHDEKGYLKNRLSIMSPMATPYIKQYNRLPDSWLQAVFASLDPEGSIRKFASFARMADEGKEALFVAVEDWLNEGVDLSSGVAETCLINWYEKNEPFTGSWRVLGRTIDAATIEVPTMVIAAQGDRIVPPDSALGFSAQNKNAHAIVCETGHVGLLAGSKAVEQAWKPIADWCAAQQ